MVSLWEGSSSTPLVFDVHHVSHLDHILSTCVYIYIYIFYIYVYTYIQYLSLSLSISISLSLYIYIYIYILRMSHRAPRVSS